MRHFVFKGKPDTSPVKTLCEGVWILRPRGPLMFSAINCPKCIEILIGIQKKRLKLLEELYLKVSSTGEPQ